jgi:hypothetical protein
MGWISRFLASEETEPADPCNETVINGAPYATRKAIRSSPANPAAPGDRLDRHIAEEIKRRRHR